MPYKPQPPKMPGYAAQNINPDKDQQTEAQTIDQLQQNLEQLKQFIGVKYTLSNPSSNYASPLDAFYTRAGALPGYLMQFQGPINIGPNGSMTMDGFVVTNNSPIGGSIAWSNGIVTYQGVQYTVASGNTANLWVYWQKSSPNAFQTANAFINLGADDFFVFFNPLPQGIAHPAFNLTSYGNGGGRAVVTGAEIVIRSTTADIAVLGEQSGFGFVKIVDTSGNVTSFSAGPFATSATAGTHTLPANPAGFLPVVTSTGGVASNFVIPFYNP